MSILISFDVGTTAMKCCAFSDRLELVASSSFEYQLTTRGAREVEADPGLYFRGLVSCLKEIFAAVDASEVAAVGITSQGETLIPLDRMGSPVGPAIVWLDTRAADEASALLAELGTEYFYQTTGLSSISGAAPVAKLKWLFSRPGMREKVAKVLLVEDYLVYRLTGVFAAEPALVCSTLWYDIRKGVYDPVILKAAGIPEAVLPELRPCGSVAGHVTPFVAALTGLPAGTPVVLTAMDQTAAAVGAGNLGAGSVTETTGTCLTVMAAVSEPDLSVLTPSSLQYYVHWDGSYLALA